MKQQPTEEVIKLNEYIKSKWKFFQTQLEVPLSKIFPEPENNGLKHIWRFGSADLIVYRDGKPVCIFEPGGQHHWEDRQSLNDRRKYKLCEINKVRCLHLMNGVLDKLSNTQKRRLVGRYLFGLKTIK